MIESKEYQQPNKEQLLQEFDALNTLVTNYVAGALDQTTFKPTISDMLHTAFTIITRQYNTFDGHVIEQDLYNFKTQLGAHNKTSLDYSQFTLIDLSQAGSALEFTFAQLLHHLDTPIYTPVNHERPTMPVWTQPDPDEELTRNNGILITKKRIRKINSYIVKRKDLCPTQ